MKKADLIAIKITIEKIIISFLIIFSIIISFFYYKQNKEITQLRKRVEQQEITTRTLDNRIDDLEEKVNDLENRIDN